MNSENSGCLWSQEYFPGKRCICSRRGQAGQLDMEVCTQKKKSATMIWFDLTKMIFEVQKRGKCDLLQWGRRDPGPHGNVDFLWRKATQKRKKRYSCLFLRRYFVEHSYHDNGVLNHILDDGKLVNHSHTPNAGAGELGLLQQPNLHAQPWSLLRLRTSFYLCSQRYSKRRGGKDEKNLEQLCIPVNSYSPFSVARRLCYLWISCLVFGSV